MPQHVYYTPFPPRTVKEMVREAEISLQTTVGGLQKHTEVMKSPNLQLDTTFRQTNYSKKHARRNHFPPSNHKHKGLRFTRLYWNFDWIQILRSEETKIELFGNEHSRWVQHEEKNVYTEENTIPTVKYVGGSVMMWDCFPKGPRNLVRIMVFMMPYKYQDILDITIGPASSTVITFFFLNAPIHTKIAKRPEHQAFHICFWTNTLLR